MASRNLVAADHLVVVQECSGSDAQDVMAMANGMVDKELWALHKLPQSKVSPDNAKQCAHRYVFQSSDKVDADDIKGLATVSFCGKWHCPQPCTDSAPRSRIAAHG